MAEPLTAAQRAMSTAEIIGLVITNMSRYGDAWAHDLLSCALVNKKWMMDSLAMMWKSLHNDHRFWSATYDTNPPGLDVIFFEMRPDRRQFYANFVCCATINPLHEDYYGEDPWAKGDELEGIVFPKMTVLHVMLKAGSGKSVSGSDRSVMDPILPSLNCPKLHTMDFSCNGPKVTNRVSPDTWESVFWDLPTKFPSLQYLDLGEDAHAHIFPYALRRLQKRHPNLKDLECLEAHEIRRFTESEVHDEDDTDSDEDSDSQNDFNEDLRADNDADGANVDDEDSVD